MGERLIVLLGLVNVVLRLVKHCVTLRSGLQGIWIGLVARRRCVIPRLDGGNIRRFSSSVSSTLSSPSNSCTSLGFGSFTLASLRHDNGTTTPPNRVPGSTLLDEAIPTRV